MDPAPRPKTVARRRERAGEERTDVRPVPIAGAVFGADRLAVVIGGIAPASPAKALLVQARGFFDVPVPEPEQGGLVGSVAQQHAALGAAVESREMIEHQGLAVDDESPVEIALHAPAGQIPSGHVAAGVAQDFAGREKGGRKVDPALVGEQAAGDVVPAEMFQPILPPSREAPAFRPVGHRQKSKIVDAVAQGAHLVVENRLRLRFGLAQMRRHDHIGGFQRRQHRGQRREHGHVGVEIDDGFGVRPFQQVLQNDAFDRGAHFDLGVAEQPGFAIGNRQIVHREHFVDGGFDRPQILGDGFRHRQAEAQSGVVPLEAAGQDLRLRQVVQGDAGEDHRVHGVRDSQIFWRK